MIIIKTQKTDQNYATHYISTKTPNMRECVNKHDIRRCFSLAASVFLLRRWHQNAWREGVGDHVWELAIDVWPHLQLLRFYIGKNFLAAYTLFESVQW